jgi:hypothetical protein
MGALAEAMFLPFSNLALTLITRGSTLWVPDTLHVAVELPVRRRKSTGMIQRC